ncbi:MAG: GlyGly-CTERM sorting domain-containing protein [Planctomycetota bacterium]|nr:MAG: GlyGly-CTERM sorting domain-containing protein [Planctomycetota bacterium]
MVAVTWLSITGLIGLSVRRRCGRD